MENIHATDIRSYLECRRKFWYSNILRLKPKVSNTPEYFDFGTNGHKVLAAHYKGEGVQAVLNSLPGEQPQHLGAFYKLYKEEYAAKDVNLQIVSIEQPIVIPFKGYNLEFTMDLAVLNQKKPKAKYEIYDHKWYKSLPDLEVLKKDYQFTFYIWAARRFGLNVDCLIGNFIRKRLPKYPTPLARGGLSTSEKSLAETEYSMYLFAIEQLGLDQREYQKQLNFLKARGSLTFKRYRIQRTEAELKSFEEDLPYLLDEIHSDKTRFYPIPSLKCKDCAYNFLCTVHSNSGNFDRVKDSMFELKQAGER